MESSSYCWQCPSLYMKAPVSGLLCQREGWRAHPSPLLLPSGHAPLRPTPGPRALLLPCPRPRGAFGSGGARGARGARGAGAAAGRKCGACPGALRKLPKMRKRRALGGRCDFGGERREEEELATRAAPQLPRRRAHRAPGSPRLDPALPRPRLTCAGRSGLRSVLSASRDAAPGSPLGREASGECGRAPPWRVSRCLGSAGRDTPGLRPL